jgi:hypothetical protein
MDNEDLILSDRWTGCQVALDCINKRIVKSVPMALLFIPPDRSDQHARLFPAFSIFEGLALTSQHKLG